MIEGFHIDVTSEEMHAHLKARAAHHEERAEFYRGQEKIYGEAPTAPMTNDPVKGLQEAGKRHKARAEIFAFFAKHVPMKEVYRLSENELAQLEFVGRLGY